MGRAAPQRVWVIDMAAQRGEGRRRRVVRCRKCGALPYEGETHSCTDGHELPSSILYALGSRPRRHGGSAG